MNATSPIPRPVSSTGRASSGRSPTTTPASARDFGPTLLTWLERARPEVYEDILRADIMAQERFSGHGSALAHPFHHLILPLLSRADKETEVRWGIRDFEDRFGRFPEGMWLPEMAVDWRNPQRPCRPGHLVYAPLPQPGVHSPANLRKNPPPVTAVSTRPCPTSAAFLAERR